MAGSCEYGDEPSGSGATELDVRADIVMDVYLRTEVLNYTIVCNFIIHVIVLLIFD
jgi:hypothetical protein